MNKYFLACILVSFNATTFCTKRIPRPKTTLQVTQTIHQPEVSMFGLSQQQIINIAEYLVAGGLLASMAYFQTCNTSQQR